MVGLAGNHNIVSVEGERLAARAQALVPRSPPALNMRAKVSHRRSPL